jgi:hypothetical protein
LGDRSFRRHRPDLLRFRVDRAGARFAHKLRRSAHSNRDCTGGTQGSPVFSDAKRLLQHYPAKSGRLRWLPGRPNLWYLRNAARNCHQLGDPENKNPKGDMP